MEINSETIYGAILAQGRRAVPTHDEVRRDVRNSARNDLRILF